MEFATEKCVTQHSTVCSPKRGSDMIAISSIEQNVSKLLSQWTALQMAVKNEWGGSNSLKKSKELASDILTWLLHSKESFQVEDLENLLHERLLLAFNTEIEDGSIEEVAEELMVIHDEYLQQHFAVKSNNPSLINGKAQQRVPTNMGKNLDLMKKRPFLYEGL